MSITTNLNIINQNPLNQYSKFEPDLEEYQNKIDELLEMIEDQFTKSDYQIEFQIAYSKCHEICLNRMAKELYTSVSKLLSKIIISYQETLVKCNDTDFMNSLIQIYQFFSSKMLQVSDVLSYLERVKQKYNCFKEEPVLFMGTQLFYQIVIFEEKLQNKILNAMKIEYSQIRSGNLNKIEKFHSYFQILIDKKYGSAFFDATICPIIKNEAKIYYENYSKNFKDKLSSLQNKKEIPSEIKKYLDESESFLITEEKLLQKVSEKDDILNIVMENLIISNFDILYKKGAKKFFKQNDLISFKTFYDLIFNHQVSDLENNMNKFYATFTEMLQKSLKKLMNTFVIFKKNQTLEYFNFYQYVEELCDLKQKYTNFLKNTMNNNQKIEHIIKNSFEKQVNQNTEFLFSFIKLIHEEIKLCQKIRSNNRIKEFSNKFFTIFKLINDKDLFENEYRKALSKRLIRNSSMIKEMEVDFYKIMKKESGCNYVKKLENMIHDIFYSQSINFDFRLNNKKNNVEQNIEFYIKIVSQDNWPLEKNLILNFSSEKIKNTEITEKSINITGLPESLKKCFKEFANFYYSKFTNRYISFVSELSWIELNAKIKEKNYSLIVSTHQMILLMFYNKKRSYDIKSLLEMINLSEEKLKEVYQPLVKSNLLIFDENEKKNTLSFNEKFDSEEARINLNYKCKDKSKDKSENKKDKEVSHFLIEDRKYQIDASIIHVLKQTKKISFDELKMNVTQEVKGYFIPEISLIKSRLDNLMDRNFIKRDEKKPDLYIYIA